MYVSEKFLNATRQAHLREKTYQQEIGFYIILSRLTSMIGVGYHNLTYFINDDPI